MREEEWKEGREEGGEEEEEREEEINKGEIREAIKKLKEGKAAGIDEIPNEIWKYGGEEIEEWTWSFCNRIWKGEGWPEKWKEGIVVPILKKTEGKVVGDYRGGDPYAIII